MRRNQGWIALAGVCGIAGLWLAISRFGPNPPIVEVTPSAADASGDFQLPPASSSQASSRMSVPPVEELKSAIAAAKLVVGEAYAAPQGAITEASSALRILLGGSLCDYVAFARERGAVIDVNLNDAADVKSKLGAVRTWLEAYREGRVDLTSLRARWRYRNGRLLEVSNPAGVGETYVESFKRFPVLSGTMRSTKRGTEVNADTIEYLVPTTHEFDGQTTNVVVGIWITRHSGSKWAMSRAVVYYPTLGGRIIMPPPL